LKKDRKGNKDTDDIDAIQNSKKVTRFLLLQFQRKQRTNSTSIDTTDFNRNTHVNLAEKTGERLSLPRTPMDNESFYTTESTMVDEGASASFLTDNLVPLMVTTGCVTVGLFGALFAVKNESKKR
jgi:hypothetical protein